MDPQLQAMVESARTLAGELVGARLLDPAHAHRSVQELAHLLSQGQRVTYPQLLLTRGLIDQNTYARVQQRLAAAQGMQSSGVHPGYASGTHQVPPQPPNMHASGVQPGMYGSGVQPAPNMYGSGVQPAPNMYGSGVQRVPPPAQPPPTAAPGRIKLQAPSPQPAPADASMTLVDGNLPVLSPEAGGPDPEMTMVDGDLPVLRPPAPAAADDSENLASMTLVDMDLAVLAPPGPAGAAAPGPAGMDQFSPEESLMGDIALPVDPAAMAQARAALAPSPLEDGESLAGDIPMPVSAPPAGAPDEELDGAAPSRPKGPNPLLEAVDPSLLSSAVDDQAALEARRRATEWAKSQDALTVPKPAAPVIEEKKKKNEVALQAKRGPDRKRLIMAVLGVTVAGSVAFAGLTLLEDDPKPKRRRTAKIDPGPVDDDPLAGEPEQGADGAAPVDPESPEARLESTELTKRYGSGGPGGKGSKGGKGEAARRNWPPAGQVKASSKSTVIKTVPLKAASELTKLERVVREHLRANRFKDAIAAEHEFVSSESRESKGVADRLTKLRDSIQAAYRAWKGERRQELDRWLAANCYREAWALAGESGTHALEAGIVRDWQALVVKARQDLVLPVKTLEAPKIDGKQLNALLARHFHVWKQGTARLYDNGGIVTVYERRARALCHDFGAPAPPPELRRNWEFTVKAPVGRPTLLVYKIPLERLLDCVLEVRLLGTPKRSAQLALLAGVNRRPYPETKVVGYGTTLGVVPAQLTLPVRIEALAKDAAGKAGPDLDAARRSLPIGVPLRIRLSVTERGTFRGVVQTLGERPKTVEGPPARLKGVNQSKGYVAIALAGIEVAITSFELRGLVDVPRLKKLAAGSAKRRPKRR